MRVALFVPCYVAQLAPGVARATRRLLAEAGVAFDEPADPTCCGQPFLTAGAAKQARRLARRYLDMFGGYDRVVTPSGSCAATLRERLPELTAPDDPVAVRLAERTHELCELLVDVVGAAPAPGPIDARVGLHPSCHALRALRLGAASELPSPGRQDPARALLDGCGGVEWTTPDRPDECCGFGGVFCVQEPAVSRRMGADRVDDHVRAGAQIVTSTDVSCLAHMRWLARGRPDAPRFVHVAELLSPPAEEG